MKFTALTSLLAATAVSAVPTPEQTAADVKAFNLMSLRSASPIHFGSFSATKSSIFINLPAGKQGATCEGDPKGVATFSLKDGQLFLYDGRSTDPQQIFVDRSGMGQGKIGYITGDQQAPKNSELKGWGHKKNGEFEYLNFKGQTLLACPGSVDNSWSVWLNVGNENPGGNKGCLGLSAMVEPTDKPVSCEYSQ